MAVDVLSKPPAESPAPAPNAAPTSELSTGRLEFSEELAIYWERRCLPARGKSAGTSRTDYIVLIMGFAAPCDTWAPLIEYLRQHQDGDNSPNLEILTLDNRGIGSSSCPADKTQYTTDAMARDALLIMDHVGWGKAHIAGFSMGGMIVMKLAALAPDRVQSLTVLGVTGGGTEAIPRRWRSFKFLLRSLCSSGPEKRAYFDIKSHFSQETLRRLVPSHGNRRMQDILVSEYMANTRRSGPQSDAGREGQMHAVWNHRVTKQDQAAILAGGFPIWFVHGRHDLVAMPEFAERLAARFGAPCIMVNGAHLIVRENATELGAFLLSIMRPQSQEAQQALVATLRRLSCDGGSGQPGGGVGGGGRVDVDAAVAAGARLQEGAGYRGA